MTTPNVTLFTFTIPDYWTLEQALAVVEFIGDVREAIWAHYGDELIDAYRQQHLADSGGPSSGKPPDASSF
jgi:hypothetical protein